jgi:hypothetical protein
MPARRAVCDDDGVEQSKDGRARNHHAEGAQTELPRPGTGADEAAAAQFGAEIEMYLVQRLTERDAVQLETRNRPVQQAVRVRACGFRPYVNDPIVLVQR